MKKNIIKIVALILVLLIVAVVSFIVGQTKGFNHGELVGFEKGKELSFTGKLQVKHKSDPAFIQCFTDIEAQCVDSFTINKELQNPQIVADCDDLLTNERQEECRTIYAVKSARESGDESACDLLKSEANKAACIFNANVTKAVNDKDPKLCDSLSEIDRKACIDQAVMEINKMDPDEKWCEFLAEFEGPEKEICLMEVNGQEELLLDETNLLGEGLTGDDQEIVPMEEGILPAIVDELETTAEIIKIQEEEVTPYIPPASDFEATAEIIDILVEAEDVSEYQPPESDFNTTSEELTPALSEGVVDDSLREEPIMDWVGDPEIATESSETVEPTALLPSKEEIELNNDLN